MRVSWGGGGKGGKGRGGRKWQRVRVWWEGRREESASNDDSVKPSQSGLREDAWILRRNECIVRQRGEVETGFVSGGRKGG